MNEYLQPRQRTWTASFLLDSNKLTRIQDILTSRLTRMAGPPVFKCNVTIKNGTTDTFRAIPDVLALDNTRRNPISSLTVSAETATGADSPAGCVIEFLGKLQAMGSLAAKHHITLRVEGENQIEKSQTFAAVEEQIERTLMSPWPVVSVALALIGVLLLALFVLAKPRVQIGSQLPAADVLQLDQLASDAKNADDKLNFLFDVRRREIHSLATLYEPVHIEQLMTLSAVLKTLVLVGLIGMLLYMLSCYRANVFLWGDYGEYLQERRKVIRNIIIGTVLLGTVVNLFSADLWQHYQQKRP